MRYLKESVWELRDEGGACRINIAQDSSSCMVGCATLRVGLEVTIGVTIHDEMSKLRKKEGGGWQLRHELRAKFRTICCQECINDSEVGETVELKLKRCYKTPRTSHETTLGRLGFEQFQSIECREILPSLSMRHNISYANTMIATKPGVRFSEDTTVKAVPPHMVHE